MKPVDWAGNRHVMKMRAVELDLTKHLGQELLCRLLRDKNCCYVHVATPCGTHSRSREIPLRQWIQDKGMKAPRPLRSLEHIRGLPDSNEEEKKRVEAANILSDLAADVASYAPFA